jgi:hypothetical protein
MLGRLKFEFTDLVNQMLDQLPNEVWSSSVTTFLDPAMGGGQFVREVEQRLRNFGHSDANIAGRVYGVESNKMRVRFAVNKYKLVGTYINRDFLGEEANMKFDVVVGNPPFQRSDNKAKRWTLWEEFVNRALDECDHVAMIVPQSLTSPGKTWRRIRKHATIINIDVKQHFNIGSSFCYFVVDQSQEGKRTKLIDADSELIVDISSLPFLPKKINTYTLSLLDKLVARKKRAWRRGELHTSSKDRFDNNGIYEVLHTNAQTLHTNFEHSNKEKIRVAVTLSGYPKFEVIYKKYCSQATLWTEFDTIASAESFADECNDKDIQEIVNLFKWSGWNSKEVISLI